VLVVSFRAGNQAFALLAIDVVEVVPRVPIRPIALGPAWVAGVARLRGSVVPVIDFVARISGEPAADRMSTRIAIVAPVVRGSGRSVGLLVERLTGTSRIDPSGTFGTLAIPDAPFLGEVVLDGADPVQLVRPGYLIPRDVEDVLFAEAAP
jgi:chemotaxis-related protein WspB